jgi:type III restriction enzyme
MPPALHHDERVVYCNFPALQDDSQMIEDFFARPILNSPYEYPARHWELDKSGQPTSKIAELRRRAEFITPIPKPKKRKQSKAQKELVFDEGLGLSTEDQQYDPTSIINEIRRLVDDWRELPNPSNWRVTPETARLLQHWRTFDFQGIRPFFCQIEAVETAIWLSEVAPKLGKTGRKFLAPTLKMPTNRRIPNSCDSR